MIVKDKIKDERGRKVENKSNLQSLLSDEEKECWQENIFNTMETFENFQVKTENQVIKANLQIMIEDLDALFDYYSKGNDSKSFARIHSSILAALDLLNLEKKYNSAGNQGVPINIEQPIQELRQTLDLEVRKLYVKSVVSAFGKVIQSKDNSPRQQEKDLEHIKKTLALLKQNKTISLKSDAASLKPVKKVRFMRQFSFEAVVGSVICWFAFIVLWPDKYTNNLLIDAVVGLGLYIVFLFFMRRYGHFEKTAEEPIGIQPGIDRELNEDQKAMGNKAKKQIVLLKDYNEKIPDEKVSQDINDIIYLIEAIMAYLEKYPNQASSMNKFLDYYLPTVMKLLEVYQLYDDMPNISTEMETTLERIEESLKSMKQALGKKIEQFYQEESMAAGANIAMLSTLLHQEGLLKDSLGELKGGTADE